MPGKNGTSIAKLKNADGKTIGWAVLWENSGLAVLWLGDNYGGNRPAAKCGYAKGGQGRLRRFGYRAT